MCARVRDILYQSLTDEEETRKHNIFFETLVRGNTIDEVSSATFGKSGHLSRAAARLLGRPLHI